MKPIIYPYSLASRSARLLADKLDTIRVRENGHYKPRDRHLLVNWGNPRWPKWMANVEFLNLPNIVEIAHDKLKTLQNLKANEVSIPEFTTKREEAISWIKEGTTVVARSSLVGSRGIGIHLYYDGAPIDRAFPLYVKYIPKKKEFRVHVFCGKVIDVQQKKKIEGEDADYQIRSHNRGWIFAREDIVEPKGLRELAIKAVQSLGLDFGAVDIIWNEKRNSCYVLEVNTAPGLEGKTITSYVEAINESAHAN